MFQDLNLGIAIGYPGIFTGKKQVSALNTATPLSNTPTKVRGVFVSVDPTVNAMVAIGDSLVMSGTGAWRGGILYIGNEPIFIPTDDLNKVYIASDNASAIVCFTYFI